MLSLTALSAAYFAAHPEEAKNINVNSDVQASTYPDTLNRMDREYHAAQVYDKIFSGRCTGISGCGAF